MSSADEPEGLTYRGSGVDIDAQDEALRRIKETPRATRTPGVLTDLGSFGGMFPPISGGSSVLSSWHPRTGSGRSSRSRS